MRPTNLYAIDTATTPAVDETPLKRGGSVAISDGHALLRDAAGNIVIRFDGETAEVTAPGELVLAAPAGGVHIRSRDDVTIEAGRDLRQQARGELELVAGRIAATAQVLVQQVERAELSAVTLVERTRDAFRETRELLETRAGRLRTLVERGFHLTSQRTTMLSEEETSIDGKKILLG